MSVNDTIVVWADLGSLSTKLLIVFWLTLFSLFDWKRSPRGLWSVDLERGILLFQNCNSYFNFYFSSPFRMCHDETFAQTKRSKSTNERVCHLSLGNSIIIWIERKNIKRSSLHGFSVKSAIKCGWANLYREDHRDWNLWKFFARNVKWSCR